MQREFSYPVLKAILPNVPFQARLYLSRYSGSIKTINEMIDISFSCIRFDNPIGDRKIVSYKTLPGPSATLSVDSVVYQFIYHEKKDRVEIKCSLAPRLSKFTYDLESARKYFQYFIQFPFDLLDLKECLLPFQTTKGWTKRVIPKCRSLRWDFNQQYFESMPASPLGNCRFDKVELYNMGHTGCTIAEPYVTGAKHVVVNSAYSSLEGPRDEANFCFGFFRSNKNQLIEFTMTMNCVFTFIHCCTRLLKNNLHIGSFYKSIYFKRDRLKQKVIEQICEHFPDVQMVSGEGELLAVLESNEEFRVEVKWEANEEDDHETFTVVKTKILPFDN